MSSRYTSPFERYGIATPLTDAALRLHVYAAGETISQLADRYLGDWRLWRLIAEHDRNKLEDVRQIVPGTILVIPQRPLERGRYISG